MEEGIRVVRGPDWDMENQDGGDGNLGTMTRVGDEGDPSRQVAWVRWDCGNSANYRAGLHNKHDLLVFDSVNAGKTTNSRIDWFLSFVHPFRDRCCQRKI